MSTLTKNIRSYLNHNNIEIHTPQMSALDHGTAEGIPNLDDGVQNELFAELFPVSDVARQDLKTSLPKQGRIEIYGSSQARILGDALTNVMAATPAGQLNQVNYHSLQSVSEFSYAAKIEHRFHKGAMDLNVENDGIAPIVILTYLSNSMMVNKYGRPRMTVKRVVDPPTASAPVARGISVMNLNMRGKISKPRQPQIQKRPVFN